MEGEDRDASPWRQALGQQPQKRLEGAVFVVDRNAKCLEHPSDRALDRLRGLTADGRRHASDTASASAVVVVIAARCCRSTSARASTSASATSPFSSSTSASPADVERREQPRRWLSTLRIHPQVERALVLERESARWIVELHRRHAEIGENDIRRWKLFGRQHAREPGEIAAPDDERGFRRAVGPEAGVCPRQFDWIDVEREHSSARQHPFEERCGVPAVAERGVDGELARQRRQDLQDFLDHDRPMHPSRSLP